METGRVDRVMGENERKNVRERWEERKRDDR